MSARKQMSQEKRRQLLSGQLPTWMAVWAR